MVSITIFSSCNDDGFFNGFHPLGRIFLKISLKYRCFTVLYSEMIQLHVYIYPLYFGFPSHLGYQRALSRIPCYTVGSHWLPILYKVSILCIYRFQSPNSFHYPTFLPLMSIICSVCVFISALQIVSFVPFF